MVVVQQQLRLRALLYLAFEGRVRIFDDLRVLRVRITLTLNQLVVPYLMQVGRLAEPLHRNQIAAQVFFPPHMHRAIEIAGEVHDKAQRVIPVTVINPLRRHVIDERVVHGEKSAVYLGAVHHHGDNRRVRESALEVLVMPSVFDTLRVDIIALDLIRPVGPIDHSPFAEDLIY